MCALCVLLLRKELTEVKSELLEGGIRGDQIRLAKLLPGSELYAVCRKTIQDKSHADALGSLMVRIQCCEDRAHG
jgi:hypothetical protein